MTFESSFFFPFCIKNVVDIVFIGRLFLYWNKNTLILNTWSIYDNSTTFALEDKFSSALER